MTTEHTSAQDVFSQLAGSELTGWAALAPAVCRRQLNAGQALFSAGQARPQVFVVLAGVIKMVYETSSGDAWIKGFAEPGDCFASLTALQAGGATSYCAYAVAPTLVEEIDFLALQRVADQDATFQRAMTQAFKLYGQRKEQRERELLTLTPEDRYLGFLRSHPQLARMVRQHDIASYVRVTPVALSRIKSRLKRAGRID